LKTQTNLVRRKPSGMYYFRARVPALLVPLLGKKVIFDSLKTTNKSEATAAAAKRRHELQQELDRLKQSTPEKLGVQKRLFLSDDEARAICERYLVYTLKSDDDLRYEGMSVLSSDVYKDILESYAESITASVVRGDTSVIAKPLASYLRDHVGIELDTTTLSYKKLAFEFLKTEAEATRSRLARQRGEHVKTPQLSIGRTTFDAMIAKWAGLTSASLKTEKSFKATFDELSKLHPGLFVETTSKAHILQWRDALMKEKQAAGTIEKKITYLKAVFNVAVDNDVITVNPLKGVKPPSGSDKKSRIPFSNEDLHTFFKSEVYTGHRPLGGGGEAAYWIPLLSLYSGARLEELAQLRRQDVQEDKSLGWYLKITDVGEGASVKSESARRSVPIHSELRRFGFMEYIAALKCSPEGFIFPDLKPDRFEDRGGNYSKWFGRYKRKVGIVDKRKVFHSFRHGFMDACRECAVPRELRDVLVGHANQTVADEYGSGTYPLAPLFDAMASVQYRGLDLTHLYRAAPPKA